MDCKFWMMFTIVMVTMASAGRHGDQERGVSEGVGEGVSDGVPEHVDEVMYGAGNKPSEGEQCSMLNQVQSAVIQILNNHYEYGRGIHRLHNSVDSMQNDVSNLKDELSEVVKKQDSLSTNALPDHDDDDDDDDDDEDDDDDDVSALERWATGALADNTVGSHVHEAGTRSTENVNVDWMANTLRNLSSRLESQSQQISALERRYRTVRRLLKKSMEAVTTAATPVATTQSRESRQTEESERLLMEHMMTKQREINGHLEKRLNDIQAALEQETERSETARNAEEERGRDCPAQFIRHYSSCYRFMNTSSNWVDSEKRCQVIHPEAHLVSIESKEEAEYLVKYRFYNQATWTSHYVWTGGNDLGAEGDWRWVGTASPVTYTMWKRGEPNNHNNNQHCMYFYSNAYDHSWDDWNCHSARLNFICEIRLNHDT